MTLGRLLLRNLFYHWRGNFAVLLGVAVGTAVLAGALFVGDSLRGSLHDRVVQRLGWVDHALVANRFFREQSARQLSLRGGIILLRGTVRTERNDSAEGSIHNTSGRLTQVTILGVDDLFWSKRLHTGSIVPTIWDRLGSFLPASETSRRDLEFHLEQRSVGTCVKRRRSQRTGGHVG